MAPNAPLRTMEKELVGSARPTRQGRACWLQQRLWPACNANVSGPHSLPRRGAALTDLLGGRVHAPRPHRPTSSSLQGGPRGRAWSAAWPENACPCCPDVPAFIEQGIPGMVGSAWASMIAPAGTPHNVVEAHVRRGEHHIQSEEARRTRGHRHLWAKAPRPRACDAWQQQPSGAR